ncbi:hypothetical protein SteCoe_8631 [Stentor coeruleus]|uniref:Uncharacterized protein n=1 Tax=Stentor coeruleus TaxID=5963 RepID=A0A1R2CJR8_9CILI|nr:hypothetical protein SteCoe_8631 [Stentor coeruleus]
MEFGLGSSNITATDYLSKTVLPALDYSLAKLIDHIIKTKEIDKWKEAKDEEYIKIRRDARRKQRRDAGESVSGSEEWEESEGSEEKVEIAPPFDPVDFIADSLMEFREKSS